MKLNGDAFSWRKSVRNLCWNSSWRQAKDPNTKSRCCTARLPMKRTTKLRFRAAEEAVGLDKTAHTVTVEIFAATSDLTATSSRVTCWGGIPRTSTTIPNVPPYTTYMKQTQHTGYLRAGRPSELERSEMERSHIRLQRAINTPCNHLRRQNHQPTTASSHGSLRGS